MKFLLDQGLPRSAVRHLADVGLASDHVGTLGLATATDEAILAEGRARDAIVVTHSERRPQFVRDTTMKRRPSVL